MFEYFTDRARKAMHFANSECLGFNSPMVNSEHLLLGLLKEGSGYAHNILIELGVEYGNTKKYILKGIKVVENNIVMGNLPASPLVKKIIGLSIERARSLNNNYVGTEHLLYGLIDVGEGMGYDILFDYYKLTLKDIIGKLDQVSGHNSDSPNIPQETKYQNTLLAIKKAINTEGCNKDIISNIKKLLTSIGI